MTDQECEVTCPEEDWTENDPKTSRFVAAQLSDNIKVGMITELKSSREVMFRYDEEVGVWRRLEKIEFTKSVRDVLDEALEDPSQDLSRSVKRKLLSQASVERIMRAAIPELCAKNFAKQIDIRRYVVNFKNGILFLKGDPDSVNLKYREPHFLKRNRDDYVSEYIDYDFKLLAEDHEVVLKIRNILKQIANDDEETLEFLLGWLGYCMTGEIKEGMVLASRREVSRKWEVYCV
jgi:phage/plasmid-associated DNA primase